MVIQPYPEIHEYIALFMDGRKVKRKIHSLESLTTPLHLFGWPVLRKIILRFAPPSPHPYYFPYAIHNITLEQDLYGYFRIQFYHYYNVKNERIEIPLEQQYYDLCALDQFLFEHPVLYYAFYGRILRPPFLCFALPCVPPVTVSPVNPLPPDPAPTIAPSEVCCALT